MSDLDAMAGRSVTLVLGTSAGGVGSHVRSLAERLVVHGATVVVCGPVATERLFDFSATGARFVPVPVAQGYRPMADRRAVSLVRTATARADIVHAHGLRAGYVALRSVRRGVPLVVTWHNLVLAAGARRRVYAAIEKRVATGANLSLAVSSDLVARIDALGGSGVLAPVGASRPPAIAVASASLRRELGAEGRRLVLSIGRLHPQKGFDVLIDAAVLLARHESAPLFAIAGDGPMRAELERRIAATGAPVALLGRRDDVAELLATADIVVMPSRWEGSPLAAHEALFAGRPLIASAVGGLPDLGADGAIDLVPAHDPVALAAAIRRVIDDPQYAAALGNRGAARALTWPDAVASADAVIRCYAELLAR